MSFCADVIDWNAVLATTREQVSSGHFNTWLQHTKLLSGTDDALEIAVPNVFTQKWLQTNYREIIASAYEKLYQHRPKVNFQVDPNAVPPRQEIKTPTLAPNPLPTTTAKSLANNSFAPPSLNPAYTFKAFIAGSSNRIAHAACQRAVENPGEYTPLVIHGGHGLGKTHLLQAIAQSKVEKAGGLRIHLRTAEQFVHEYLRACQERTLDAFRRELRACDVFLLDDLQVIGRGNKTATQEELLHTFEALLTLGKQIVVTSDHPPAAIDGLHTSLVNRLTSGLIARIDAPDESTQRAIFLAKIDARSLTLTPETLSIVTGQLAQDVRVIEGIVGRLAALQHLGGLQLTPALVREELRGTPSKPGQTPTLNDIVAAVADAWEVSAVDLTGSKRVKTIASTRKIAIHLSRRLTRHSLSEIGAFYGGRTHATIHANLKKSASLLTNDPTFLARLETALRVLGSDHTVEQIFPQQKKLFQKFP